MRKKSILEKLFLLNALSCCVICVMFLFPFWAVSAPASVPKGKTAERVPAKPAPQYGGILKILLVMEPASLGDPVARPFDNMGVIIANGAVETLARYDQKGMPVPWLATGWKVSKDLRSIIFTLRKGVKFHDGTDFDAAAAKWNLDRYRTSDNPELKSVESIDVVDDSTIRLNLSTWSSTLIDSFTMHAGMMISPTSFQKNGTDWAKVHPTGTGPFKFVSWQRDTGIKFEKFPGYWQKGKPYLDGVEWTIIADEVSRKMAFIKGDGNVLYIIEPKDVKDLEKDGKYYFSAGTLSGLSYSIGGDSGHADSPFADVRVRQAVEHAIDKKALVDTLLLGYGKVNNQYAYPGSWGVNPAVTGYPYDPAKAKKLLAAAGYPSGFKTTFTTPNWGTYPLGAPVVQEYLGRVGIKVEIDPATPGRFNQLLRNGWKGLIVIHAPMVTPDAVTNLSVHASCKSYLKGSMACADDYESTVVKAIAAPNFETKKKLVWEAQKLLVNKHALINFLYTLPRMNSFYKTVHDTGIGPTIDTQWTPEDAWISK